MEALKFMYFNSYYNKKLITLVFIFSMYLFHDLKALNYTLEAFVFVATYISVHLHNPDSFWDLLK